MNALKLSHTTPLGKHWELDATLFHLRGTLFGRFGTVVPGHAPEGATFDWDSKDNRSGLNLYLKQAFDNSNTQMVFGYNYDIMKVKKLGIGVGAPPVAEDARRELNGLMGQVEQRFPALKLQLIAGLRFDHYSDFGDHASPRLAFIFHPTDESALKLLYGNAFRAPSINEQSDNGVIKGGGMDLDPELVDTYEIIWTQSSKRWHYSLASYLSKVTDTISIGISSDPSFGGQFDNNVDSKSYGLELDASYQLDRWQLFGNISSNKAKFTKPSNTEAFYQAYPDLILHWGFNYQVNNTLAFSLNNMHQKGRKTWVASELASFTNHRLSSLSRSDMHISWKPQSTAHQYELYFNVRDIFDNQDERTSQNSLEIGTSTAGLGFNLGAKAAY